MTSVETIEALLRNPATSRQLDCDEIGHHGRELFYGLALHQLIPINEHERPWIVIVTEEGEREIEAYDSPRLAEADYAADLDRLRTQWSKWYSDDEAEDDD